MGVPSACPMVVTEGLGAWGTLFAARGYPLLCITASVVITICYQTTHVGLNKALQSVTATVILQLQPVVQVLLAAMLSGGALGKALKLSSDASALNVAGLLLIMLGALCY